MGNSLSPRDSLVNTMLEVVVAASFGNMGRRFMPLGYKFEKSKGLTLELPTDARLFVFYIYL
jgi:hypothetical protein